VCRMCLRVPHVSACAVCVSVLYHVSACAICLRVPHVSARAVTPVSCVSVCLCVFVCRMCQRVLHHVSACAVCVFVCCIIRQRVLYSLSAWCVMYQREVCMTLVINHPTVA